MILTIIFFILLIVSVYHIINRHVEATFRSERARANASKRNRWSDGTFAKVKTTADMQREVESKQTGKRMIPVNDAGVLVGYITL